MKRIHAETSNTIAKVNVTPIIDVALVLVIILMITAPMIAVSDVDVKLPEAATRNLEGHDRISVTLGALGELAVDDRDITLSQLQAEISTRLADHKDAIIVIRADRNVTYGSVKQIVQTVRAAGATRIAVGTQQRGTASSIIKENGRESKPIHDARGQAARKEVKS